MSASLVLFLISVAICNIEHTSSQGALPVMVFVGWTANFSFQLQIDPMGSIVGIKKNGIDLIINVRGTSVSYKDERVNFTGDTHLKQIAFSLRSITLNDAGRYIATISGNEAVLGEQTLIVKASPTNPQIVELDIAESGSNYRLNCSTKSNSVPSNHGLAMKSEWKRSSTVISSGGRYIVQGTELIISNLSYGQDNGARFTCFAYEDQLAMSNESDAHITSVKYGPENIQLSPPSDVITERETRQIIVHCTADCNPLCSFQWRKGLVSGSLPTNQSLIINTLSKDDAGRYTCTVNNTVTGKSKSVQTTVIVIYGPTSGQVMLSPSESNLQVEENTIVNINCSADCNPVCIYIWAGPQGFAQTGALLSKFLGRDKGGTYACTATNQENTGKTASASVTITVVYGPGNSVHLGSISSTLDVDLHQKAPNITCTATCNPPCDYRWNKDGTFYSSGATLSVGMVEKSSRGIYICQAYNNFLNSNRSSSISLNITVFYAPEVLLEPSILPRPSVYIVKLGQTNVDLRCVVIDANPSVQQFVWTKDAQHIPRQTGQALTITVVTRDTIGKWGCKGTNSKGDPMESTLDIDVHYGPIISNISNMMKVEGETINVTCIVDSRPPSSIGWTKSESTTFTQNKAELYIVYLNRSDKGTYECTASNNIQPTGEVMGERITVKSNFFLDVTYGAGIVNLSAENNNTVNENSSVSFYCHVDSNPLPTITWRREDNNTVLMTESGVMQSQFRIVSAQCLDMGNYSCTADNGIWVPVNETLQFFVRCHPRTDFRLPLEIKIYGKRHTAAVLRYTVISYPLPNFTWRFTGNGSESRSLPSSASQHDSGRQSELRFTSLDIDVFGNYSVTANNSLSPSAKEVFEIIPADVPEVPSNVTVISVTPNSVTIQWVAGYNGGPEQTFHIAALAGEFTRTATASDPGYRKNRIAVLQSLLPKTKYTIYVTAQNSVGPSNMTEAIIIETPEESKSETVTVVSVAAVAGGIGAGIVVILSAVVAIFLWRRYQHPSQHSDEDLNKELEERGSRESGLVDNLVYDSSGPAPGFSINNSAMGAVYAEVVKPKKKVEDPSSLYAQVNKNIKMGNKGGAKEKGETKSKGDIYENAMLSVQNFSPKTEYENSKNVTTGAAGESLYEDPVATTSNVSMANKDGLLYADLMLDPPTTKNGKTVIRGIENRTEYAEIAYGKRGEPLPDIDDKKEKTS